MKKFSTTLPALAALFWGIAIVVLYMNGRMGDFLVPRFHSITLIGGLGMIVLGIFILLTLREESDCGHDHCDHDHDHHDQNPLVVLLLMVLPLSAALATDTSNGFSLDLLERKGLYNSREILDNAAYALPPFTLEMLESSTPKNETGSYQLPVSQLFFSAGDEGMMEVFDGLSIETEGQVVSERDENEDGLRLRLYRTLMTCCAADAMVLGFPIEFESVPPIFEERSWVRIEGTFHYEDKPDGKYPLLKVKTIEATSPPNQGGFGLW